MPHYVVLAVLEEAGPCNQKQIAECIALEDASHYVQEDRPDRVAEAIRRVIERTEQREVIYGPMTF